MTQPFRRPSLAPPAPCWIVRTPPGEDFVEIVYVGHCNRAELESSLERLARWPWAFAEDGHVTILGDSHADPIGVRLENLETDAAAIAACVAELFDAAIVCRADHRRPTLTSHNRK